MPGKKDVRIIRLGHLKTDKFAAQVHAQNPKLIYNGGPLLATVEVFTVFWGSAWKDQPALASLAQSINDFFKFILSSPLIDQLREYNAPAFKIGHGTHVGSTNLSTEPGQLIDDSEIQVALQSRIAKNGSFPKPNANSLFSSIYRLGRRSPLTGIRRVGNSVAITAISAKLPRMPKSGWETFWCSASGRIT